MTHDDLQAILKQSFSVKLLTSPNAALILSLLDDQFKQTGRVTLSHTALVAALDAHLQGLHKADASRYPGSASYYLSQWCDDQHRFLRKYYAVGSDDPVYELTSESERALSWVADLHKVAFIGTESRFRHIVSLLKEMVANSTADPTLRLRQLEAEQAALQTQIDTLTETGEAERYSATQFKERFESAGLASRQLLSDFRQVEENFRDIARSVQEQQFQAGTRKGDLLRYVLDTDAALKSSDQGRSFYGFWQFLLSPSRQEELQALLERLDDIPELKPEDSSPERGLDSLRHLKRHLIEAGSKVVASNRRLMQQLRQILDEQHAVEAQRVRDLMADICQSAMQVAEFFPEAEAFITIETTPDLDMPMERQLWESSATPRFGEAAPQLGEANLAEANLSSFYSQLVVDERQLARQVDALLEHHPSVTLAELVETYPIERGLSEVITYLSIAAKGHTHTIDTAIQDTIALLQNAERCDITLPRITFSRT